MHVCIYSFTLVTQKDLFAYRIQQRNQQENPYPPKANILVGWINNNERKK